MLCGGLRLGSRQGRFAAAGEDVRAGHQRTMTTRGRQKNRHCAICGAWFRVDPRVGSRQRTCGAEACRKAWRSQTLRRSREEDPEYWRRRRLRDRLEAEQRKGARPAPVSALPMGRGEILLCSNQDSKKPEILAVVGLQPQERRPSKQDSIILDRRMATGSAGQDFSLPMQDPNEKRLAAGHDPYDRRCAEGP